MTEIESIINKIHYLALKRKWNAHILFCSTYNILSHTDLFKGISIYRHSIKKYIFEEEKLSQIQIKTGSHIDTLDDWLMDAIRHFIPEAKKYNFLISDSREDKVYKNEIPPIK